MGVVDAVLITRFEPHVDRTSDGYHERHHWAVVNGRAIGLVRYEEVRNGQVARSFTFNRNAPSRSVPLSSLIVHPIPDPPADVPMPEPEPDPMPTLPTHLTLRSAHGRYLCAESGGGTFVVADREAAREWETWRVMPGHTPTTVALQASDGHYLCAHEGGGSYVVADRQSVGPWESWRVERHGDGIALRADTSGLYLCAEYGGSVTVTRTEAHAWEIWTPAKVDVSGPSVPTPEPGEPIVSRMVGRLQVWPDERAFSDDNGPYLPVLCHAGDLLSRWTRDPVGARALMADIAAAGYDGVRTWTVLHGDYWRGREVGPMHQADYWSQVLSFAAALRTSGLRWLVSQGDMLRAITRQSERRMFMQSLAGSLDADMVLGVDAGNEALWNGETDPARLREAVDAFRSVQPCAVWSLTSPYGEDATELNAHAGSVYDVHGYRDGRSWDKIRHIFSIAYEVKPRRGLGIQSEPFGFGDRVSVTANKHELTAGAMALACAVSLLSRQAWVWFSGPGVMSDERERMQDMPGFRETPAMRAALPADLMTFGSLVHGGASQKGRRIWAVPSTDETRCDHAMHADGRYVVAVYGPRWRDAMRERSCHVERRIDCGEAGFVEIGRLA